MYRRFPIPWRYMRHGVDMPEWTRRVVVAPSRGYVTLASTQRVSSIGYVDHVGAWTIVTEVRS